MSYSTMASSCARDKKFNQFIASQFIQSVSSHKFQLSRSRDGSSIYLLTSTTILCSENLFLYTYYIIFFTYRIILLTFCDNEQAKPKRKGISIMQLHTLTYQVELVIQAVIYISFSICMHKISVLEGQ